MSSRRGLLRDQRGAAVLVIGLFTAMFLTGLIFFLLGMVYTLPHRARVQDAADSAAYSVATMEAHALNRVALLNMTQASVVAPAVASQAIAIACAKTLAWIAAKNDPDHSLKAMVPVLKAIMDVAIVGWTETAAVNAVVLPAVKLGQLSLKYELPYVAERQAANLLAKHFSPPVKSDGASFTWPLRPLPIETGSVKELCSRTDPYSRKIAKMAFIPVVHPQAHSKAMKYAKKYITKLCRSMNQAPQKLMANAVMGQEPFQLRSFVLSNPLSPAAEMGVRVASWRNDEPGGRVTEWRDVLSRVGFAQSEAYFEGENASRDDMLWEMKWRPRLRRFRMPGQNAGLPTSFEDVKNLAVPDLGGLVSGVASSLGFAATCSMHTGEPVVCAKLGGWMPQLAGAVVH
jgi:hypothetical protein